MDDPPITAEERFAAVVAALVVGSEATFDPAGKKGFGSSALTIDGKIFAMLVKGKLVVKLPRRRVDELIAAGTGERFDPGHGRLMKEWLAVEPVSGAGWQALASEAMVFVGARH